MSSVPVFAEPEELYALVLDTTKQPGKDYVIVDVRDADFKVCFLKIVRLLLLGVNNHVHKLGWAYSWSCKCSS